MKAGKKATIIDYHEFQKVFIVSKLKQDLIDYLFSINESEIAKALIRNETNLLSPFKKDVLRVASRKIINGDSLVSLECGIIGSNRKSKQDALSEIYRNDFSEPTNYKTNKPLPKVDYFYERLYHSDYRDEEWNGW